MDNFKVIMLPVTTRLKVWAIDQSLYPNEGFESSIYKVFFPLKIQKQKQLNF